MSFIWFLFMALAIFSVIRRLVERTRDQGKFDVPWGGPPSNRGNLPWRRTPRVEERETRSKLNLPEYLTRRSGEPASVAAAAKGKEKPVEDGTSANGKSDWGQKPEKGFRAGQLEETAVLSRRPREDQKEVVPRDCHRRYGERELFDDIICPGEVLKGVVWSQILGPRGGLRAKKR